MEVILEPISTETTDDVLAPTTADDPPPPAELPQAPSVLPLTSVPEPDAPVKRPRGRPKGKAAAKAPAPKKASVVVSPRRKVSSRRPPSSDSSSDEETQRQRGTSAAVRHLMDGDDMETQVLQFLLTSMQNQAQKRHALWQQLASSGLRR